MHNRISPFKTAIAILTVLFFLNSACTRTNTDQVTVITENFTGNTAISLMMIDTNKIVQLNSLKPDVKKKRLETELTRPMLFFIKNQDRRIEFIAQPSATYRIDVGYNRIIDDPDDSENKSYNALIQKLNRAERMADSLAYVLLNAQPTDSFAEVRENTTRSFEALVDNFKLESIAYIDENPGSIGVFRAINSFIKQTPVFNYTIDHEWFHKVDSLLNHYHPEHPYSISFHNRVIMLARNSGYNERGSRGVRAGDTLPDIKLVGLNKKSVSLDPASEGVTLLYLWDHTMVSRKTNLQVKQIAEDNKDNQLKLFAIAFDENFKRWANVITIDKMWYNNMIDTAGYNSPLLKRLNNPSLPCFVVIDKNRKVLTTGSSATGINEWIKKYSGKK